MSPKSWIPLMCTLYSNSSAEPSKTPAYFYKLPYIGTFSNATQNKLRRILKRYCKNLDIKLLVFSTFKLRDMFSVQDTVLPGLRSQVVYKFACASYIGETTMYSLPHFHVRPWAPGFGQKFTRLQTFTDFRSLPCCMLCRVFYFIDSTTTSFQIKLKEAMHIKWEKPTLNLQVKHVNLSISV